MSFDAVALLRIPDFTPPEDLDVRELDDGFLLFLGVPYEDDPDALLDAIVEALGEAITGHEDERGIFVLPDAAEPDQAATYDAVIAEVGDAGMFIGPDDDAGMPDVTATAEAVFGQMFESLGVGSMEDLARALQSGDQDALKMAQIRMTGAMERAMTPSGEPDALPADAPAEAPSTPTEDPSNVASSGSSGGTKT